MSYFIVYSTEDRELGISEPLTEQEAQDRIAERYYGDLNIFPSTDDLRECNKGYGNGLVVIKGDIVTPKPVEVVTKYKF